MTAADFNKLKDSCHKILILLSGGDIITPSLAEQIQAFCLKIIRLSIDILLSLPQVSEIEKEFVLDHSIDMHSLAGEISDLLEDRYIPAEGWMFSVADSDFIASRLKEIQESLDSIERYIVD